MQFISQQPIDWGRGDPRTDKFDPSVIQGPTFLLRNQPADQFYKESNLELSNVRAHDQLMPGALKENLYNQQILRKFPMNHPFTSQISLKAVFPSYTAPEDSRRGEAALKAPHTVMYGQTPAQAAPTIVVNKNHGTAWRHEVRFDSMPSQQQGQLYNDKEYYNNPKPDHSQQYYPAPPTLLVPNPKLRQPGHAIDARTAETLKNKELELLQSSHRIDYYADGLGTRAPLNNDQPEGEAKPYFRRGDGISMNTNVNYSTSSVAVADMDHANYQQAPLGKVPLTDMEKDEIRIEHGQNYKNYPRSMFVNNPKMPVHPGFKRSNTIAHLTSPLRSSMGAKSASAVEKQPANKTEADKMAIDQEHRERIQKLQLDNRQKDIDRIRPEDDMRLLRLKYKELENTKAPQPFLKQNYSDHVRTFYDQEAKYLGERAELYRTDVYNPYVVKEHIDCVKEGSAEPRFSSENNKYISSDLAGRPKMFADRALGEFKMQKRAQQEALLTNPHQSAHPVIQEDGFILQQTTYGDSYNTKKYLQEHELVSMQATKQPVYEKLDQSTLNGQNIVLKSRETQPEDANSYPRVWGPMPPEPYEPLYCNNHISEMSDGYSKRFYHRVYDSPNVTFPPRYAALKTDQEAMHKYEEKQMAESMRHQEYLDDLHRQKMDKARESEISHVKEERAARRDLDNATQAVQNQTPQSTYSSSYTKYSFDRLKKCPPNEFYKSAVYTGHSKPRDLIGLQDSWSKTHAHRQFHSAYPTKPADLRENIQTGKKKIKSSPLNKSFG